jgi:hypothetical protein
MEKMWAKLMEKFQAKIVEKIWASALGELIKFLFYPFGWLLCWNLQKYLIHVFCWKLEQILLQLTAIWNKKRV